MEEGRASIMQMLARLPRPLPSPVTKKSISLTNGAQWMLIVAKKCSNENLATSIRVCQELYHSV